MIGKYRGSEIGTTYAINDENGTLLLEEEQIAEYWKEYFEQVLDVGDAVRRS